MAGSAVALIPAMINRRLERPLLYIAPTPEASRVVADDLESLLGRELVRWYPADDRLFYETTPPSSNLTLPRVEALAYLLDRGPGITVTSLRALAGPLGPPESFRAASSKIAQGAEIGPDDLARRLVGLGFQPEPIVEEPGCFSRRGGILDVFPAGRDEPVRIEFFGDTVESIRTFDPTSQRSSAGIKSFKLLPRSEFLLTDEAATRCLERMASFRGVGSAFERLSESLYNLEYHDHLHTYIPWLYPERSSLFDYLSDSAVIFWDQPELTGPSLEKLRVETGDLYDGARTGGLPLPGPEEMILTEEELAAKSSGRRRIDHRLLAGEDEEETIDFRMRSPTSLAGNVELLRKHLAESQEDGHLNFIACETDAHGDRLKDILEDDVDRAAIGALYLASGFVFPETKLNLLCDHQVFNRLHRPRPSRRLSSRREPGIESLNPGDHIAHIEHGIGRFSGLKKVQVEKRSHDCLELEFAGGHNLLLPVERIDRIERYSYRDGEVPVLSKLGGRKWEQTLKKVRGGLKDMAEELLNLYRKRDRSGGVAFTSENPWQAEVEASFLYEETPDQIKALEEVNRDLESAKPMDRLVAGDVGFGKTEVAIRAAFKVVTGGKQAAVLVPTTILAQQHLRTFQERLGSFPVKIEMLSRFRTPKEQREVLKELKAGTVDIVIGTHRLLSKDIVFNDLGLLIVDEEHRFGVRHKEKIKSIRVNVDVLTLSATPIPRTLHMALAGIRNMSTINTPPKGRLPVHTEIVPFDEKIISEVIKRETDRGGQVYFVHNRVETINPMAVFLKRLLPDVSFDVAHGQMEERTLEKVMVRFLNQRFQVLISTMIIESGLDLPNVNTIIINRADRFGLAQLYQLRGRVGRSYQRAFAYLMVPPSQLLSEVAMKRLRAIEEADELASGLRIAMKDLEIRGAGNILGSQQHGFMMEVGFDLYARLLSESVREAKGELLPSGKEPKLKLALDAHLPDVYVEDSQQKIELYRRMSAVGETGEVDRLDAEITDRFGPQPTPVKNLLDVVRLKLMARDGKAAAIERGRGRLIIRFTPEKGKPGPGLAELLAEFPEKVELTSGRDAGNGWGLSIKLDRPEDDKSVISSAKKALQLL
jgi:transcription-repair coupling factor (superfamily II helicase)